MNISIVDDSQSDLDITNNYIKLYLSEINAEANIFYYNSGTEFLEKADLNALDLLFLDIYLNDMTGVEIAKKIRKVNRKCSIILNSVSKNFIHDSYDINALYYLIKPYEYDVFKKAVQRAECFSQREKHYVEIISERKDVKLDLDDIIYVDKYKNSVQIHINLKVFKIYSTSFNELQNILSDFPNFIHCFNRIIVNMNYISKVEGRNFILNNGEIIPINRTQFPKIKDLYANYIFKTFSERGDE